MAEKLSVVMARKHLEAADVALMIIDAVEGITASDATIAGYAHESGRSVIIVINKWDLVTATRTDGKPPAERSIYEEQVRRHLKFLSYAPVVFVSASTGREYRQALLDSGTGRARAPQAHRHRRDEPLPQPHRFRTRFGADVEAGEDSLHDAGAVSPPTFILFTDRQVKLHFSYERFLENQIRAAFGFVGTPIWIKNRARNEKEVGCPRRGVMFVTGSAVSQDYDSSCKSRCARS